MNFKLAIRTVGLALIIVVMGTFAQEMEENALRARFMRLREIITGEYCFYVALFFSRKRTMFNVFINESISCISLESVSKACFLEGIISWLRHT